MRSRKRMAAIVLFAAMLLCMVACGDETNETGETLAKTGAAANTAYSGTILAMSYDSITLSTENGEITVALTDSTTYSYDAEDLGFGTMGGMMGKPDGEMQKPDGDMEPPEGMDGETPEESEAPDNAFFYDIPEGLPETDPEGIRDIPDPGEADTMFGMSVETLTLGSAVTVQTDASGNASSVTLTSSPALDSFGGMMGMGGFGGADANGFDRLDGSNE